MGFELPETLKVARQMQESLSGKNIIEILLGDRSASLIKQKMCNLDRTSSEGVNTTITAVSSKGKWIYWNLSNDKWLVFGEVIGKFAFYQDRATIPEHTSVAIVFEDGSAMTFTHALYAFIELLDDDQLRDHPYAQKLGISPDDEAFSFPCFSEILSRHGEKILKAVLNLQSEICGLGNVYINDILYEAALHPKRKAATLSEEEKERLYRVIVEVTRRAIEQGGCTEERDLFNHPGAYQRLLDKNSAGKECSHCGTVIVKENVLGSACYICPGCQGL